MNLEALHVAKASTEAGEGKGLELDPEEWEATDGKEDLTVGLAARLEEPGPPAHAAGVRGHPSLDTGPRTIGNPAPSLPSESRHQANAGPPSAVVPTAVGFEGARVTRQAVPEHPVSFVARLTANDREPSGELLAAETAPVRAPAPSEGGREVGNESGGSPAEHQTPHEFARETAQARGAVTPPTGQAGLPENRYDRLTDWRRELADGRRENAATAAAEVREPNWVVPSTVPSAADISSGPAADPSPVPTAAEVVLPDLPAERLTAPPRELVLTIPSGDNDGLVASVHVKDANGAVEIAVRTPDSQLSNSLQEGLPDLVSRLETPGFDASASRGDPGDHQPTDWSGAQERDRPSQEERRGQPRQRQQERRARWQAALGATASV